MKKGSLKTKTVKSAKGVNTKVVVKKTTLKTLRKTVDSIVKVKKVVPLELTEKRLKFLKVIKDHPKFNTNQIIAKTKLSEESVRDMIFKLSKQNILEVLKVKQKVRIGKRICNRFVNRYQLTTYANKILLAFYEAIEKLVK